MKKFMAAVAVLIAAVCFCACKKHEFRGYGVFLGVNEIDAAAMSEYGLVVVDASAVPHEQIAALRARGGKVYSYLNVGTIEDYRDYYAQFERDGLLLDVYGDWPDERFVDVSDARWQDFVVETLAADLAEGGIDGFFLDNFDVYYYYEERPEFLSGLVTILRGLKSSFGLPIMINGGDSAVKEILKTDAGLVDSVNQECVFTGIDFDSRVFTVQDPDTSEYYKEYLAQCKSAGLEVYLLEYGDKVARSVIANFCAENGYSFYISANLDLT